MSVEGNLKRKSTRVSGSTENSFTGKLIQNLCVSHSEDFRKLNLQQEPKAHARQQSDSQLLSAGVLK